MRTTLLGGLVANAAAQPQPQGLAGSRLRGRARVPARPGRRAGPLHGRGIRQPARARRARLRAGAGRAVGHARPGGGLLRHEGRPRGAVRARARASSAAEHPALHPGRAARVLLDGQPVGWIGSLHPRCSRAYELPQPPVLFEVDIEALLPVKLPVPVSRMSRDSDRWCATSPWFCRAFTTLSGNSRRPMHDCAAAAVRLRPVPAVCPRFKQTSEFLPK